MNTTSEFIVFILLYLIYLSVFTIASPLLGRLFPSLLCPKCLICSMRIKSKYVRYQLFVLISFIVLSRPQYL